MSIICFFLVNLFWLRRRIHHELTKGDLRADLIKTEHSPRRTQRKNGLLVNQTYRDYLKNPFILSE